MINNVNRIVPYSDDIIQEYYQMIVDRFPDCTIIQDDMGVYRFKQNSLLKYLAVDLNKLSIAFQNGCFSLEEYAKFYMDIGYSLSGWLDIFQNKLW